MATVQCETSTSNAITLKGSTELVTEFFGYAVNNILFQRGVYPPDQFSQVPKYGLTMLVTNDTGLQQYLGNVTKMIRSAWPSNQTSLALPAL